MIKFLRLIQNEYAKLFHQAKTWVMLALVVLSALGLNLFAMIIKNQQDSNRAYDDSLYSQSIEDYYDEQNGYLEREKQDGYQREIEKNNFLKEHQIEYGNHWRVLAVDHMFALRDKANTLQESGGNPADVKKLQKWADSYEKAALNSDWKAYCKLQIDVIQADESKNSEQKEIEQWEYQYRLEHEIPIDPDDWKSQLVEEAAVSYEGMAGNKAGQSDAAEQAKAEENYKISLYMIEHNIKQNVGNQAIMNTNTFDFWSVMGTSTSLIQLISVFIVVIAGSCVASEFSSGTTKFLLINPVKRGKILMAKYGMVISYSLLLLLAFYVLSVIFTAAFWGTGEFGALHLSVSGGKVIPISAFLYIAQTYVLGSVNMIVAATLAFAISSLMKSSALAIGISIFALLAGNGAVMFLKESFHLDWARYIVFANTDLNAVINQTTPFANQSVAFALIVIAVYMIVFLFTAWDGFVRREV